MSESVAHILHSAAPAASGQGWIAALLAAAGIVVGLVLWLGGGRVLRPIAVVAGGLVAAGATTAIWPSTPWAQGPGGLSVGWAALAGTVIGLMAAWMVFRAAVMVLSGLVAGGLAVGAGVLFMGGAMAVDVRAVDTDGVWGAVAPSRLVQLAAGEGGREQSIEEARTALGAAGDWASGVWESVPPARRAALLLCGAVGCAAGIVLALRARRATDSVLASLVGAAVWLAAACWLTRATSAPWAGLLDRPASWWLAAWLGAAAVGLAAQGAMSLRARGVPGGERGVSPRATARAA